MVHQLWVRLGRVKGANLSLDVGEGRAWDRCPTTVAFPYIVKSIDLSSKSAFPSRENVFPYIKNVRSLTLYFANLHAIPSTIFCLFSSRNT
jgi:hypothetical protein